MTSVERYFSLEYYDENDVQNNIATGYVYPDGSAESNKQSVKAIAVVA